MAERAHLDWFRKRIAASLPIEPTDPTPILEWLEKLRRSIQFKAELIALDQVRDWSRDAGGSIRHKSGQFFGIEGVRIESGSGLREVKSWDQPIFTQLDGGLLGLFARESEGKGVQFLLRANAEPGNIGILQLGPTIQSTMSNIRRAHAGKSPPMVDALNAGTGLRIVYRASHNEEGGRFWQKSNINVIAFVDDESVIEKDLTMFCWASLSQIKELALMDNVLNPFVKTILAPL